jgi:hypothetical protein
VWVKGGEEELQVIVSLCISAAGDTSSGKPSRKPKLSLSSSNHNLLYPPLLCLFKPHPSLYWLPVDAILANMGCSLCNTAQKPVG